MKTLEIQVAQDGQMLGLRNHMEEMVREQTEKICHPHSSTGHETSKLDELVTRLNTGEYPIEMALCPKKTAKAFKTGID